jgi:O-antigen/teichoic acid export membrane protein
MGFHGKKKQRLALEHQNSKEIEDFMSEEMMDAASLPSQEDEQGSSASETDKAAKKHIRGSSFLFVGRIISIALKAFLQLLIVNYLAKEEYGAFAYVTAIIEIAAIFTLISLDQAASRFIPLYQEKDDYDSIFGFMLMSVITIFGIGIAMTIAVIAGQSILLGTVIENELTLHLLALLVILAPLQAMDSWFQSVFAVFASVKAIFFRRYLLAPILQISAVLIVMLLQSGIYLLSLGYLIAGVIGSILYIRLLFSLLRKKGLVERFKLDTIKMKWGEVFGFSLPLLTSGLVQIMRTQLAVVLLEAFKDANAVADFRAVQPIARLNIVVYQSFIFLYLPLVTRLFAREDKEGIDDLYWRTASWIALATFPVFIVTFALAPSFVPIIFPEEYASASPVMAIFALGVYLNAALGFNIQTLRTYGNVRLLMAIDFIVMLAAIGGYVYFIPLYGALGAAMAYTLTMALSNLLYHIGLVRFTAVKLYNPRYLPIYISIIIATIFVGLVEWVFNPSIFITLPLAGIVSLVLLRINASRLSVGEIFPELMKVPFAKYIFKD